VEEIAWIQIGCAFLMRAWQTFALNLQERIVRRTEKRIDYTLLDWLRMRFEVIETVSGI